LGRRPIPRDGYLDSCEYLGYLYGERRWRNTLTRRLQTWDERHGKIEALDLRGHHVGVLYAMTGEFIKPPSKGGGSVSDVRSRAVTFFDRYAAGEVQASAVDDYVATWHASGEVADRPLAAFLGMTDDEYAVWAMDGRTLPMLRAARCAGEPVRQAAAGYLEGLRTADATANRAAVLSLSRWLERQAFRCGD